MRDVVGIGIDLVEVKRMAERLKTGGFRRRAFTRGEQEYCETGSDPAVRYAGVFAVKEAFMKALGAGIRQGVWFTQIEVPHGPRGTITVYGRAAEILRDHPAPRARFRLSQGQGYVTALLLLTADPVPPRSPRDGSRGP